MNRTAVRGDTFKSAMALSACSGQSPFLLPSVLTANKTMYSRFTVLVMFVTLLALLVNAAPIAESVHKRDVVGSHQWIARLAQSAATVPDQAAEKKYVY